MQVGSKKRWLCVTAICFCTFALSPHAAISETGDLVVLPSPFGNPAIGPGATVNSTLYSTKTGLHLEVDTRGVGERGFRPVEITVTSTAPVVGDRQITFRFSARSGYSRSNAISVEQDFELSHGTSSTSTRILVPQFVHWDRTQWEVWVDGELDDQLGITDTHFSHSSNNYQIFAIGLPDGIERSALQAKPKHLNSDRIDEFYMDRYPSVWTDYSTADIVVITPRELQILSTSYPHALQKLLRWVRVGGNLWIFESSTEYENLPRIESQLKLNRENDTQVYWQALPLEGAETRGIDALLHLTADQDEETPIDRIGESSIGRSLKEDSYQTFITRALGLGTITLFRQRFDNNTQGIIDLSLLTERLHWPRRHGNDPGNANLDFNNFLIPDVGLAPVFEFQFLITLFVLGIGPLNYWLLKRSGKIPMLLATVPAAAIATTVLLFAYGYVSEGVGTRVRVRSYTYLDQPAHEVSSWSRLSYYAGVAPAAGIAIPEDTVIYPILPASTNHRTVRRYANQWREVLWEEARARLTEGWLPSRTPSQFLSLTARSTNKQLKISRQESKLQITNDLGVDIVCLAIRDEQGKHYLANDLGKGESVSLQSSNRPVTTKAIREQFLANDLVFPPGGDLRNRRSVNYMRMSQGLLETHMAAIGTLTSKQWARQTYLAITASGIEIELGLDGAEETHSFHVVKGVWEYD